MFVATCEADDWMQADPARTDFVKTCLKRHLAGDWGDISADAKAKNDAGLGEGEAADQLHSVYTNEDGTKIWIITEWNRAVTTVLFPEK